MATEDDRRARKEADARAWAETRRAEAARAGKPEWVYLPTYRDAARARRTEAFFWGGKLSCGHVSAQDTRSGQCHLCRERQQTTDKDLLWRAFEIVRDRIEATGCLHWVERSGGIGGPGRPIRKQLPGLHDAIARAYAKSLDGRMHCVVPGSKNWVVKPLA